VYLWAGLDPVRNPESTNISYIQQGADTPTPRIHGTGYVQAHG
jgi:hypothetical protein